MARVLIDDAPRLMPALREILRRPGVTRVRAVRLERYTPRATVSPCVRILPTETSVRRAGASVKPSGAASVKARPSLRSSVAPSSGCAPKASVSGSL
jgi:hypothetical protein